MSLIKTKKNRIISLFVIGILTASCAIDLQKNQGYSNIKVVKLSDGNYGVDLADTKIGKKDGAKVSVNLHLADKNFKTKSTDGSAAKVIGDIQSYEVNLCTDPTQPESTKIITSPTLYVNRSGAGPHIFTFYNLSSSGGTPYYATVKAYDQPNLGGALLISPDNKGTSYLDFPGNKIAVSTNNVLIDNSLVLTFSNAPNNKLDITANLDDSVPPIIDSNVKPNNGTLGNFSLNDLKIDQAPGGTTQSTPSISINKNGNGLSVWRDNRASTVGIYARFFNDYMPDGNDFNIINVSNPVASGGNILNPTVVIADSAATPNSNNGNGFVLWEELVPDPATYVSHIFMQPIKTVLSILVKLKLILDW